MKRYSKRKMLASAVLAIVLGGWTLPSVAEADNVNSLVMPKDKYSIGTVITFGKQYGFEQIYNVPATWQAVCYESDGIVFLAKQNWGEIWRSRYTDWVGGTQEQFKDNLNWGERHVLAPLTEKKGDYFTPEELAILRFPGTYVVNFPTWSQLSGITASDRKRGNDNYWLQDYKPYYYEHVHTYPDIHASVVDVNGYMHGYEVKIGPGNPEPKNSFYPTIKIGMLFGYYGEKPSVYQHLFSNSETVSAASFKYTLKDEAQEKNVQIKNLILNNEATDALSFTFGDIATGDGQGIGGILEKDGDYVAYARMYESNVGGSAKAKFSDELDTGDYTLHIFNEKLGPVHDYAGNFTDLHISLDDNGKITKLDNRGNVTYDRLEIGKGINLTSSGNSNLTVNNFFTWTNNNSHAIWYSRGKIVLGGEFSVDDMNATNIADRTLTMTKIGDGFWNDINLSGTSNDSVADMNIKLNSFYIDGGKFEIKGYLEAADYLQLKNGAELIVDGELTAKRLEVNGTFDLKDNGTISEDVRVLENSTWQISSSGTTSIGKSLTMKNGATIEATTGATLSFPDGSEHNLTISGYAMLWHVDIAGTFKDVTMQGENSGLSRSSDGTTTLKVANNLVAEGNVTFSYVNVEAENMQVGGSINADDLKVKKILDVANGTAQGGTIKTITFGDATGRGTYYFDLGRDQFTIDTSASGKVKLLPKYDIDMDGFSEVELFTGSGDFSGLKIADARVTDNNKNRTYLLTQDTTEKNKIQVQRGKHNAVVSFSGMGKGHKLYFGNYWQEDNNGDNIADKNDAKEPILWTVVGNNNGTVSIFSDKVFGCADINQWGGYNTYNGEGSYWDGEYFQYLDSNRGYGQWMKEAFSAPELMIMGYKFYAPWKSEIMAGGSFGLTDEQRKAVETSFLTDSLFKHGTHVNYGMGDFYPIREWDWVDGNGVISHYNMYVQGYGTKDVGIRPVANLNEQDVLFARNFENGTTTGNITRLKDVDGSSTLELTFDDAYLAFTKNGWVRSTRDIALGNISLDGGSVSVGYSDALYVDGNSYLSFFVGEGNQALDYFAYGRTKAEKMGSGTVAVDLGNFADSTKDTNGYALTFFNEYGNGSSFAGELNKLPGAFTVDTEKNLTYKVAVGDVNHEIKVGKNNVVELTGTGTLGQDITGEGKVKILNNGIAAPGNSMQADFETVGDTTVMDITGDTVKCSLKGNFNLTGDKTFSGKRLQGKITSSSTEKLKLDNDVQVNGDLQISNLDGNSKTLDMRQNGVDQTLTIGTLKSDANWAIDVDLSDLANLKSDKIVLNGVESGAKITLTAVNITKEVATTPSGIYTVDDAVTLGTGVAAGSVVVQDELKIYTSKAHYTVTLEGNNLKFNTEVTLTGLAGYIANEDGGSYSFLENEKLTSDIQTGVNSGTNYLKTVFMNGHELTGGTGTVHNGITVVDGYTLNMTNGTISGFDTALTVASGGTLTLGNVTFSGNTTDVNNGGTMNIHGSVTMQHLTGDGTTKIQSGAELNLGGDYSATQTFKGDGTLNFKGDASVAVTQLGTDTDNLAVTIAESKTLALTGTGTLNSTISGAGKINIANSDSITTDASNLQVAVKNNGNLKLNSANEMTLQKDITGNGTLEFAKYTHIYGDIKQNKIKIDENTPIDVYTSLEATTGIENHGSIMIDAGALKSDVTNDGSGTYGGVMENGAVYLYNSGTPESSTLNITITNGKVFVMNDVTAKLTNFSNVEINIDDGTKLTVSNDGTASETIGKINGNTMHTGTLVTNGNYKANLDNVQVPLENNGTMNLSKDTSASSPITDMSYMVSIKNTGTMNIGEGITLNKNISNSGTLNIANNSKLSNNTLTNIGTVDMAEGASFEGTAKVMGGTLKLGQGIVFSNANIQGLTELQLDGDGAIYNFNAVLGAEPSVDIIDAGKVTGTKIKLGTVTPTWDATLSEWEMGATKIVPYLADTTDTIAVDNTAVVFSEDNYRFTFSQAKEDNGINNKIGYLAIIKENGGELWQIVRNVAPAGATSYQPGKVASYVLTEDYTEQLNDIGGQTLTDALGTLARPELGTPREFTIEGNNHSFAGGDGIGTNKKGITVSTDDILNLSNISEIKNWNSYVVTNNGGTVNFNNVTELSSPVINTSGTVNFNGTTEVNSTLSGNGTFNNNGLLTVADLSNLDTSITELHNTGTVNVGNDTEQNLTIDIDGGYIGIIGKIKADSAKLQKLVGIDIAEGKTLSINGSTALGEILIVSKGELNLGITGDHVHKALLLGGTVNFTEDYTTDIGYLWADTMNIGSGKTLKVTTVAEENIFTSKVTGDGEGTVEFANGKVTAYNEINSKIKLDGDVDLTIAADNIRTSVEIGTNANLNLGDGTLKHDTITSNSGTVNFLGNIKVDTTGGSLSLPKATFANGSILNLTVSLSGNAPLQVTDGINVANGARINVEGASKGGTYKVFDITGITDPIVWLVGNIRGEDAEGHKIKGKEYVISGGVYSVLFKNAVPQNTDIPNILANADDTPLEQWAEQVGDAYDDIYGSDVGEKYTSEAVNTLANLNALANVQQGTQMVNSVAADAIQSNIGTGLRPILGHRAEGIGHNSGNRGQVSGVRNVSTDVKLASPLEGKRADKGAWSGEGVNETAIETVEQGKSDEVMPVVVENEPQRYDKTVWANYIHSKKVINGLKAGSLEQNSTIQFNGVTVGADLWSHRKGFGGLALTTAEGKSNSSQPGASVKNETDYQGVSLYNRYDYKGLALLMDLTYTHSKNDVSLSALGALDVTAKPKADAYSAGLKIEKPIKIGHSTQVTPYTGARFTHIHTDKYSDNRGMSYDIKDQNIFSVPVGVQLKTEYATQNGWRYGHIFEGGYVWNIGNRQSEQRLGYLGVYDSIDFDVTDRGEYFLKTALTANHKDTDFELGYRFTRGDNTKDNKWNFNVTYNFGNVNGLPYKSVLLGKIDLLESANKALRAELVEKDLRIKQLEEELRNLKNK